MARTFLRQETQIRNSDVYDDTLAAGATLESGAAHIEADLNALRSQQKRAFWGDSAGNWHDDLLTVNGKKRGIFALNTDLDDLEEKRLLFGVGHMTDVTVGAGNNYVVLSQSGGQTPSLVAAVTGTAVGAVVAVLPTDVGAHSLVEVAGLTPISPLNLCMVRDAVTGDPVASGGRKVYALIQAESGVADGEAFNDTTKQAQLSFVRLTSTGDDLEAVPSADIAGKTINYSYARRVKFDDVPETAFLTGQFVDAVPAGVTVDLDTAVDNQVGPVTQSTTVEWQLDNGTALTFQDAGGTVDIFKIARSGFGGNTVSLDVSTLDVNSANAVDFDNGILVDTAGTQISIGDTAGQIDSAGALVLLSGGSADLTVRAAGEVFLDDSNQAASTWAQTGGIKLSETTAEWDAFKALFGESSLLNSITQAATKENRTKSVAVVTANVNPDVNVTGAGGTPNLSAQLANYSTVDFVNDVDVYVNGVLLVNGANSAANNDVYPGTSAANGDLMFEFRLKIGDIVTMIAYGA